MLKSERIHVARRDAIRNMIMHSRGLEPGGTGLAPDRIRYILRNPLYNGWIRWHWGAAETRRPAAWRPDPPVSDELWVRVEDVQSSRRA